MKNLYVVKDGLKSIGCKVDINGEQIKGTNFYLLTFGKGNEGHIDEKSTDNWQLYTQIGELATIRKMYKLGVEDKSRARYHCFSTFEKCIEKLKELRDSSLVKICDSDNFSSLVSE